MSYTRFRKFTNFVALALGMAAKVKNAPPKKLLVAPDPTGDSGFARNPSGTPAIKNPGKQYPKFTSDWVRYPDIKRYEDCWNKLPAP